MNRLINAREGRVLVNEHDIFIGSAVIRYGEYSELEAQLLRQISRHGWCIVEVGANMGLHTLVLAKAVGPKGMVIAYEPQREIFQLLCANMALNDITWVDARCSIVGRQHDVARVPVPDYTRAGNFGGMALKDVQHGRLANMVTLNSDLVAMGSRKVDMLKIDVEGMEADVLFGATDLLLRDQPILYVENDRLDRSRDLIEIVWSLGYRCYWHLPPLYNPDNFFGEKEDVYPSIVSVNMLCVHKDRPARIEGAGLVLVEKANEHPLVKP